MTAFISSQRAEHHVPVRTCCRALGVSESWYFKHRRRPATPRQTRRRALVEAVRAAFEASAGTYGRASGSTRLELRHRRRARAEDRIRGLKDTGLRNLPLHGFDQNRIWCAIVALAADLMAWTQTLTLTGHHARRWEPKTLRHRLFSIAGRLAHTGRRHVLHLSATAPFTGLLLAALNRLQEPAAPG